MFDSREAHQNYLVKTKGYMIFHVTLFVFLISWGTSGALQKNHYPYQAIQQIFLSKIDKDNPKKLIVAALPIIPSGKE